VTDTILPSQAGASAKLLTALGQGAREFGLRPVRPIRSCPHRWYLGGDERRDQTRGSALSLTVCAEPLADGTLDIFVGEHNGWSPLGSRLRQAMADTVARYGGIEVKKSP